MVNVPSGQTGRVLTARIAVHPVPELLEYEIPGEFHGMITPGMLVQVPVVNRAKTGLVIEVGTPTGRKTLKPVQSVLRDGPVMNDELIGLLRWASEYYVSPLPDLVELALPPGLGRPPQGEGRLHLFRVKEGIDPTELLHRTARTAPVQAEILAYLIVSRELTLSDLPPERRSQYRRAIRELRKKGWVEGLYREDEIPSGPVPEHLTPDQERSLGVVRESIESGRFRSHLLFGVTASGKTEVYLRAAALTLEKGKGVIVLVPEIGMVPQIAGRFRARFGSRVVVLHSGLPKGERIKYWERVHSGQAPVVIGPRSVVFAPLPDPGLIIVDEEHDSAYKQEEGVRYNARDLALVRGSLSGATVVLGSATPAVESYFNSEKGKYSLLTLSSRIDGRSLPEVHIVDLRTIPTGTGWPRNPISPFLRERILAHQGAGGKVILFINRRGYSSFTICQDCGQSLRCPNCSVSLILHKTRSLLLCHYCGYAIPTPDRCPSCESYRLNLLGVGTERVEEEITREFADLSITRLDRDTAERRGAPARILREFAAGEIEVLIGTKLVTKGHDLPGVSLVGIILADLSLNLPDFRAAEHTFQLLTQVAGRAGRGDIPGEVVVQTFLPENYAIRYAARQDFPAFYETELEFRKQLSYPPFSRLVQVIVSGVNPGEVEGAAERLKEEFQELIRSRIRGQAIQVLGPSPAPYAKIRGRHRHQILVKYPPGVRFQGVLGKVLDRHPGRRLAQGVTFSIDLDPQSLL